MDVQTHERIDARLCGRPLSLGPGRAVVELTTLDEMAADATGLVHGGFVFGLADHAAMLAVNRPTVVLAGARVRFLAPSRAGAVLVAEARVVEGGAVEDQGGKKPVVEVTVRDGETLSFEGRFETVVPARHVLASREEVAR